jgi:cell division protein FtsQ
VARGSLFIVDIRKVRAELEKLPWVRSASVQRIWPDRLEIALEEHVPLAYWGMEALVDDRGELFKAEFTGELPRFNGPQGSEREMTLAWREFQSALAPIGLKPVEINVSARQAWSVKLDSGLTLQLGRSEIRERLARFVALDRQVPELKERRGYVDLRYPNGFALKLVGGKSREGKDEKAKAN